MAQHENISIDQGTDVAIEVHLVDAITGGKKNLTNYSTSAKMKKTYNSDSDDTTDFTAVVSTPETDGIVTLELTNAQTNALKAPYRYVYDVEISHLDSSSNTVVERVLEGQITVTPSVTK